jgi:hypothetical protein
VVCVHADNQDQVKPVVDEIYSYVLGAKVSFKLGYADGQNKAQEEAAKAVDQVQGTVDSAKN